MKPAFVLLCYLAGNPSGMLHFLVLIIVIIFKKYLSNQTIKIGEEQKNYDCYCKLVKVNENMRYISNGKTRTKNKQRAFSQSLQ